MSNFADNLKAGYAQGQEIGTEIGNKIRPFVWTAVAVTASIIIAKKLSKNTESK